MPILISDHSLPPNAAAVSGVEHYVRYEERPSESSFVERIWHTQSDRDDVCLAIADGRWDMMFFTLNGQCQVMITGPQTTAITIPHTAGSTWLGIRFRLGVSMQAVAINALVNEGIDLPAAVYGGFWLDSAAWSLPDYENADTFVEGLVRRDLLAGDPVVQSVMQGESQHWSPRALQYRFQQTIGLTAKTIQQIERAQSAAVLLAQGTSIADVVFQLGYYDQPHLTNALKRFTGRTPAQTMNANTIK